MTHPNTDPFAPPSPTDRTAAPAALFNPLFGEPNPQVAAGPCHTDDCTGLHWTDDEAEWHLYNDQTMSQVDPAEWLGRHPEVFLDGSLPVPRNVLDYLQRQNPPDPFGFGVADPATFPTRCTDPDCDHFGLPPDPEHDHTAAAGDDEVVVYEVDDPWAGRPVARGTFRQRWLLGPKFIRRWHLPRTDYYDVVLTVDLRSWMVGFEVWPNRLGGMVRLGPVRITIDEPPF